MLAFNSNLSRTPFSSIDPSCLRWRRKCKLTPRSSSRPFDSGYRDKTEVGSAEYTMVHSNDSGRSIHLAFPNSKDFLICEHLECGNCAEHYCFDKEYIKQAKTLGCYSSAFVSECVLGPPLLVISRSSPLWHHLDVNCQVSSSVLNSSHHPYVLCTQTPARWE